jgi:hypothetical protein
VTVGQVYNMVVDRRQHDRQHTASPTDPAVRCSALLPPSPLDEDGQEHLDRGPSPVSRSVSEQATFSTSRTSDSDAMSPRAAAESFRGHKRNGGIYFPAGTRAEWGRSMDEEPGASSATLSSGGQALALDRHDETSSARAKQLARAYTWSPTAEGTAASNAAGGTDHPEGRRSSSSYSDHDEDNGNGLSPLQDSPKSGSASEQNARAGFAMLLRSPPPFDNSLMPLGVQSRWSRSSSVSDLEQTSSQAAVTSDGEFERPGLVRRVRKFSQEALRRVRQHRPHRRRKTASSDAE